MANRPYIATDQPIVFIGGFWVDDCRAIEYQVSDPKEPLYGFRDTQYTAVARGQTVVHGMMDINFRRTGYLLLVLDQLQEVQDLGILDLVGVSERDDNLLRRDQLPNDLRNLGVDPRELSEASIASLLTEPHKQFDVAEFVRLSDAIKDSFYEDLTGQQPGGGAGYPPGTSFKSEFRFGVKSRGSGFSQARRAGQWPGADHNPKGFDITVVFQPSDPDDPGAELDDTLVETIKDAHIVASSKMIINAVPGGGEAIVERYQFIARNIE